ncbi:MAG: DUF1653 domain-containing protein [Clostridia bacterium]
MNQVKIGKVYRHFKGNYYFVENIALDSETHERVVVYKALYNRDDSQIWVRKESMFLEQIDQARKDNITGQKYRFEIAEEIGKNYIKQIN